MQEINKLLKQHKQMQVMMKRVKKMGGAEKFMARGLPPSLLPRYRPNGRKAEPS